MASEAILAAIAILAVDGDTVRVRIPAWSNTPFEVTNVRIYGIDTPESRRGQAKCRAELDLGRTAKEYARTLVWPGEGVRLHYVGLDKYGGRVLGTLELQDGRDYAAVMIGAGLARPYNGKKKSSWCGGK